MYTCKIHNGKGEKMRFTQNLIKAAKPIWESMYQHPFIQGIGNGTLPIEKYKYYLCQDYPYLIEYARVLAMGSIKAPNLDTMTRFAWLLDGTLNFEMELHRKNAQSLGISKTELQCTQPAPTALAYISYLQKTAYEGSFLQICVMLLPCMVSYCDFGKRLYKIGNLAALEHKQYGEWIRTYNSDEAAEFGIWLSNLADSLAEGLPERELKVLEEHFIKASNYDYMFLDMAWNEEKWMV